MKKLLLGVVSVFIIMFPVSAKEIKCDTVIKKYKDKLNFVEKAGKIKISEKNGNITIYTKYIPYEFYNRETINFLKECMYEIYSELDCNGQKELKKVILKEKSKLFTDLFKLKTVAVCKLKFAKNK